MHRSVALLAAFLAFSLTVPLVLVEASPDTVRFIGAYWGQNNVREEVAPGDSGARLTIALANDYDEERISGIRGELRLSDAFRSQSLTTPDIAEAHHAGTVPPGGGFELTFIVNVDESAKVGVDYTAQLTLTYRVEDDSTSTRTHTIPVKLNIPGRPVLRVGLNATSVEPGRTSFVELSVVNQGTAKASDLVVSIQPQVQQVYGLVLGEQPWVVGELPPGGAATRVVAIYASQTASDSIMHFTALTRYRNSVGTYVEASYILSLHVNKAAVSEANLRVYAESLRLEPGSTSPLTIHVENIGSVEVRDIRVRAEQAGLPVSLVGRSVWSIERLEPGGSAGIEAQVSAGQAAANGVYQIPLQVSFKDFAGNTLTSFAFIAVSVGDIPPKAPNLLIESDPQITAGRLVDVKLVVRNIHSSELRRVSVTVQSLTPRLTVVGSNNWLAESLTPSQAWEIPMQLYADPELAGTSGAVSVSATYIMADRGEQVSEQREVGFIIEGYISLRVYDLRVILVGGQPYLSGNILNEGISDALFSTVFVRGSESTGNGVFIGEIKPNAPLPFNIRLNPGEDHFKGDLVIEYKDVFRRSYSSTFSVEVDVPRPVVEERQAGNTFQSLAVILVVVLVAAAVAAAVYMGRRKRREVT
ncbi:hypothetical protein HRbin02_00300 [Candidatus Calditenuaceae archaeon HR02]|nr:hypothetical protein HRbin02_00300 [Candidatus Calditenuaceae archaeon HR02]